MHRTAPCHHSIRPLVLLSFPSPRPRPHQHQHRYPCPQRTAKSCDAVPAAASLQTGRPAAAVAATAAAATPGAADGASSNSSSDWRSLLVTKAVEPGQLVKLTLKGKIKGDAASLVVVKPTAGSSTTAPAAPAAGSDDSGSGSSSSTPGSMPYKQLNMRPVLIKGKVMLQVSLLTARQDITKNFSESQASAELSQLLQLPWSSATLVTLTESVSVQVSRKGKALVQVSANKPKQQQQAAASSNGSSSTSSRSSSPSQVPAQQQQAVAGLFSSAADQQQQQQHQQVLISLQHDRVKATPINGSVADPFLYKIGLQTAEGRIKANMQAKFTQINEFLKLLAHSGQLEQLGAPAETGSGSSTSSSSSGSSNSSSNGRAPVHILDAGCGSSHLTFGMFHYLHNVLGLPVRLTGLDTNGALMQRSNKACQDLGIADVAQFHTAAIREFPALDLPVPDIVLALHACDTATDEALAVGVLSGAHAIMSVPCCQKDIQRQFQQQQQQQRQRHRVGSDSCGEGAAELQQVQQVFGPLLEHGILKQRQLDLLTDTFRAHLLRLAGYRTDVVEFVSTEHTPRNLLIRAVRRRSPLAPAEAADLARQYRQLRDAWGVVPHLERLIQGSLPAEVQDVLSS